MKIHFSISDIYKLTILVLGISSMYPWFMAGVSSFFVAVLGVVISCLFFKIERSAFCIEKKYHYVYFLLFLVLFWNGLHATFAGFIECALIFLILGYLIGLNDEYKVSITNYVTKYFSLGLLISIVWYLLWLIGVPLPHSEGSHPQGYSFMNYYFMTIHTDYEDNILIPRFQSVFLEPGHLTMGLIPLLCLNRFNLKNKFVFILFVAEILTFSLAGYVCMIIMAFFFYFKSLKTKRSIFLSIFFLVFVGGAVVSKFGSDESSIINQMIVSRIQDYTGDNASSDALGDRFKSNTIMAYKDIMSSPDMLWGLGLTDEGLQAQEGSAGYKVYILLYGIVGLSLLFLFYLSYLLLYPSSYGKMMLLIYLLLFIQNGYPFWYIVIFSYILGLPFLWKSNLIVSNEKDFVFSPNE